MLVFTVPAPLSGRSYPSGMVGMEKRMVAIPSGDCPVRVSSPLSCIAVLCAVPLAAEQRGCEMDSCLCVGGAGCRGIVSPVYGDGTLVSCAIFLTCCTLFSVYAAYQELYVRLVPRRCADTAGKEKKTFC